ncbi:MAG: glutamyl-tRNA reductase [Pseudomonadota bacterium]
MHLLSIGLNHRTAPVEVRERAAVADAQLPDALRDLSKGSQVSEATILSTCNRTEIYCQVDQIDSDWITHWLCDFKGIDKQDMSPYLFSYPDQLAVSHAFRVAAGLDSMVLGEPQILGQMKTAFAEAHRQGSTGKVLNRLFQNTFSVAKQIRSTTAIGHNALSVAASAVAMSKRIFSDVSQQSALLIGAGDTIEIVCRHLYQQGVKNIVVANRTVERAEALVEQFGVTPVGLHEIPLHLPAADMIFSSTASTLPILGKGAIESALRSRRQKPMFIVDLAVPRDVEPEVGRLRNVYLHTVDDLQKVVTDNLESRRAAASKAEKIVSARTSEFMDWLQQLNAVPTLQDLRKKAGSIKNHQLDLARRRLMAGDDPEEVLKNLAHGLTQKMMHDPTEWLRQQTDEDLFSVTRDIFSLDNASKESKH